MKKSDLEYLLSPTRQYKVEIDGVTEFTFSSFPLDEDEIQKGLDHKFVLAKYVREKPTRPVKSKISLPAAHESQAIYNVVEVLLAPAMYEIFKAVVLRVFSVIKNGLTEQNPTIEFRTATGSHVIVIKSTDTEKTIMKQLNKILKQKPHQFKSRKF